MNMRTQIRSCSLVCFFTFASFGWGACDAGQPEQAKVAKKDGAKVKVEKPDKGDKSEEGQEDPAEEAALDPKVEQAVAIASAIEAAPGDADTILAKHSIDRDGLDELMYDIAADPDLSESYLTARAG
jgi:hypothetical protein